MIAKDWIRGFSIMKLAWSTDLHLEFVAHQEQLALYDKVNALNVDGWLISGDITNGSHITRILNEIAFYVNCPTYFVLGNHDFYNSSFEQVEKNVEIAVKNNKPKLIFLDKEDPIYLNEVGVALIGHSGWGDMLAGDGRLTTARLNDKFHISPFNKIADSKMFDQCMELGKVSAENIQHKLTDALAVADNVVVLTHVPPWPGAAWHEGGMGDACMKPYFTNVQMGKAIDNVASNEFFLEKEILVLCGHTHSGGVYSSRPNVQCITEGAEYRYPCVAKILHIENGGIEVENVG